MATPSRINNAPFSADEKAELCHRLRAGGLSAADIAQRSGFSLRAVRRYLDRADRPPVDPGDAPKVPAFSSETMISCRALRDRGLSVEQIAQRKHLSVAVVADYLKRAEASGVASTSSRANGYPLRSHEQAEVSRRLRDAGLSVADIARRSGFSVRTVQRHLKPARMQAPCASSGLGVDRS